jgi:hypothetical protein
VPYARLLIVAIALLPLGMHAIAWDTGRISAYCIFAALGCAWVDAETNPARARHAEKERRTHLLLWSLALPVLLFNVFLREDLMDLRVERFATTTRLVLYAPLLAGTLVGALFLGRERRAAGDTPPRPGADEVPVRRDVAAESTA